MEKTEEQKVSADRKVRGDRKEEKRKRCREGIREQGGSGEGKKERRGGSEKLLFGSPRSLK